MNTYGDKLNYFWHKYASYWVLLRLEPGGVYGVMVIVWGNGIGDSSSNPGQGC